MSGITLNFHVLRIYILCFIINVVNCKCYFPGELQGLWATQVSTAAPGTAIMYSSVRITHDFISTWGQCHSKVDENVILAHRSRTHSAECFRCFRLVVASVNVASLLSRGLETCYPTTKEALDSCPTASGVGAHIVLYKVRELSGSLDFKETQCPLNGVFVFSYERGDRRYRHRDRCVQPTSEMSNCRFGFAYNLQYRDCTFEQPDGARWHCLGHWKGLDGQNYLAVWDVNVKSNETDKPKYKCGIYKEDRSTGLIYLSFSRDSTCTNSLSSATDGYERYTLMPASAFPVPEDVKNSKCYFSPKFRGQWHNMNVKRNTIKLVNEHSLKAYDMQCVKNTAQDGKYVVYAREDCDDVFYTCIILKRRTDNIIEILIGTKEKYSTHGICDDYRFGNHSQWITLAKERPIRTQCPIVGSYEGSLPEAEEFCAQMYSDCSRSNVMYYAVDECKNHSSVFEQNEVPTVPSIIRKPIVRMGHKIRKTKNPNQRRYRRPNRFHSSGQRNNVRNSLTVANKNVIRVVRNARFNYNVNNPQTTTLSFLWGRSTSASPTTPIPRVLPRFHNSFSQSYEPRPTQVFQSRNQHRHYVDQSFHGFRPIVDFHNRSQTMDRFKDSSRFHPSHINVHKDFHRRGAQQFQPTPRWHARIQEVRSQTAMQPIGIWNPGTTPKTIAASWVEIDMDSVTKPPKIPKIQPFKRKKREPVKQERSYECLGEWEDSNENIYALTKRRDINQYECFVGKRKNGGIVYIMESGPSCTRGRHPEKYGMKTMAKAECSRDYARQKERDTEFVRAGNRRSSHSTRPPWAPSLVTRNWEPITGRPRRSTANCKKSSLLLLIVVSLILFC